MTAEALLAPYTAEAEKNATKLALEFLRDVLAAGE
jgi:hypothetical protein